MSKIYVGDYDKNINDFMDVGNKLFQAYMSNAKEAETTTNAPTTSMGTKEVDDTFS